MGPSSATDNAITRFDSTTGKLVQNSLVTVDDSGNVSTPGTASFGVGSGNAGAVELPQGSAPSLGTTSVIIYAPTSVTSYALKAPAAAGSGCLSGSNAANIVTLSFVSCGSSSGCVTASTAGKILVDDGAGGCTSTTPTISGSTITATLSGNASTASAVAVGGITGLGTGVATALAANVSGTGAICLASGSACSGGGSGSFVLVEQHTASSSASLDFTTCISSTYDEYQIEVVNLIPASSANLWLRVSSDGGMTYISSGTPYAYGTFVVTFGGATAPGSSSGSNQLQLHYSTGGSDLVSSTTTGGGIRGSYRLYKPASTSDSKLLDGQETHFAAASDYYKSMVGGAFLTSGTAVNAFQILFSTGNIASGTVRCYGIAK